MAVSPGSAVSLNQISLRRRLGAFGSDSLMITFYGNTPSARMSIVHGRKPGLLISTRLRQRRACPAPTVGVGHARLFATTRTKLSWFSFTFSGPQAHFDTQDWLPR